MDVLITPDPTLAQLLSDDSLIKLAATRGRTVGEVAELLAQTLDGADLVVAYNGAEVDYPVLRGLLAETHPHALEGVAQIDALYLTHAIWPRRGEVTLPDGRTVTAHTLEAAVHRAGVWRPQTHDALDDCRLLIDLLRAAAEQPGRWLDSVADIVFATTRISPAWALLAELAPEPIDPHPLTAAQVRTALGRAFADLPPERVNQHSDDGLSNQPTETLSVGDELRTGGRVDPYRLAAAIRDDATPRTAQQRTAEAVREVVDTRRDGLLEAPTGSGKSMVLLAEALNWVSSAPDHCAIISTYTKQLQSQLAEDLDRLMNTLPGLRGNVDLVKGAHNRLSLRSLVAAITALATGAPHRAGISPQLVAEPAFAELVAYLLLRLLALDPKHPEGAPRVVDTWTARSVDPVDLPGGFERWTGGALPRYLAELSQGRTGDWAADDPSDLAAHTQRVREALRRRRLVIANHALLCSTATALADIGATSPLLLLVDEAHELEHAATTTLSATLDYAAVEVAAADLGAIAAHESARTGQPAEMDAQRVDTRDTDGETEVPPDERRRRYVAAVNDIAALLRTEQLPATVAATFGMRTGADLLRDHEPRSASVAEEDADGGQLDRAATIERLLRVLVGRLAAVLEALDELPPASDHDEADQRDTARGRLVDTLAASAAIATDLADILGLSDSGTTDIDSALSMIADRDVDLAPPKEASNRIVWSTEVKLTGDRLDRFIESGMSFRWWSFNLTTTPIAVAEDGRWQILRSAATATVFTSGTLRVPGADDPWEFIRDRLGIEPAASTVHVPSDFRPEKQAILVAFSDFPSWAEQPHAATATVAWQIHRYLRETVTVDGCHGALVLTTSRATSNQIAERLMRHHQREDKHWVHSAALDGNAGATSNFRNYGGVLIGTRGLWQGVDLPADRLRLLWINKLPFPPIGEPVLEARRRRVEKAAAEAGSEDPENAALSSYYLPQAAMTFRQAVGRLLRSEHHRGVVVVSDSKLGGEVKLRRVYRRMFLGSLDDGWTQPDSETNEPGGGNVTTMTDGWARIWRFLAREDVAALDVDRSEQLAQPSALAEHVWLPETRRIRGERLTADQVEILAADNQLLDEIIRRSESVGGALRLQDRPLTLKPEQREALRHLAEGRDVLGILPTGFGKSFLYQLPGLILPGVTVVISPLVSLMTDQALKLNRSIGGQVRALTGPMRESNSRLGKAEVLQQLTGQANHDIQLVYLSPERLATAQFQAIIEQGVKAGVIRLIAFDEAHTLAAWGDSFRPAIRRAEHFIRRLRSTYGAPQLVAVTATATRSVRHHLLTKLFEADPNDLDHTRIGLVTANPIRSDLTTYKRLLPARQGEADALQVALVERMLDCIDGHAIVYCTTIKEVERISSYLSGQTGRRRRVLKYHGRMDDVEKASVADYFTTAPTYDDPDGYIPMVVVATQAFGLGIDRDDIRLVLCASPPGDLSALYQALGRAGRDQANRRPSQLQQQTVGVAILTPKAWSTLKWMNRHDPATGTLITTIANAIVHGNPPLDIDALTEQLINEGVTTGRLPESAVEDDYLQDAYRSLVVRTFAALADRGVIEDLGDTPVRATIRPGEASPSEASPAAQLARKILDARPDGKPVVELTSLWNALPPDVSTELGDIGSMWYELLTLHATGQLDVSQRSNMGYGQTANYRVASIAINPNLEDELLALQRSRVEDLQLLREWFQDDTACALDGLADYFQAPRLATDGICDHYLTRCSTCWQRPAAASEPRPPLLNGLLTDVNELRMALSKIDSAARRKTDRAIETLLSELNFGLGLRKIYAALRGEEYVYAGSRSNRLPRAVVTSRMFARMPQITGAQLSAALDRLLARGLILKVTADHGGAYYQHLSLPSDGGTS